MAARRRPSPAGSPIVGWALVIGLFAWMIAASQHDSRAEVRDRFAV